ncbi:hypothetical protein BKA62DRAFT_650189 [Auriculariales sp. MPI-PUGE-AT-0066]|nr:hypothetical protein BKA62DRAFT_650189 [Auriculariales sp. MPI-PUGE-AT-0066]
MYRSRSAQGAGHQPPPPRPPKPQFSPQDEPSSTNPFMAMYAQEYPQGPRHPALNRPHTFYSPQHPTPTFAAPPHDPYYTSYSPYQQQPPPPPLPPHPNGYYHRPDFSPGAGPSSPPARWVPMPTPHAAPPIHYPPAHDMLPPSYGEPPPEQSFVAPTGDVKRSSDFGDSGAHSQATSGQDDESEEAQLARALAASALEAQQAQQNMTEEDDDIRRAIQASLTAHAHSPASGPNDSDIALQQVLAATASRPPQPPPPPQPQQQQQQQSRPGSNAWPEYDPRRFDFPREVNDGIPGRRAFGPSSSQSDAPPPEPVSTVAAGKRPAHATFDTFTLAASESDCMSMSDHSFESLAHSIESYDSAEDRRLREEDEMRMLREMQAEEESFASERERQMALDEEMARRLLEEEGLIPAGTGSMGGEEGEREIERAMDDLYRRKLAAAGELVRVPEESDEVEATLPRYSERPTSMAPPPLPTLTSSPSAQEIELPPPGMSPRAGLRRLPLPPGPPGPPPPTEDPTASSSTSRPPSHSYSGSRPSSHMASGSSTPDRHHMHHRASEPGPATFPTTTPPARHPLPHSHSMPAFPTEVNLGPPSDDPDQQVGRRVAQVPAGREKMRMSAVIPTTSGSNPLRMPGDRGTMDNIAFGFSPPVMAYRLPATPPMPDVIALASSPSPAFHMQAPSWMSMLKALAHMSDTKLEATPRTLEKLGGTPAYLRCVVQFVKAPLAESSWRTILYMSVDNPLPLNTPRPWRFTGTDTSRLPYKFPVPAANAANESSLNLASSTTSAMKLINSPDAPLYVFAAPHAELPMSMPNVARFLVDKLAEARAATSGGSDAQSIRRLDKILNSCYPELKAEKAPASKREALKRMFGGGKTKKLEPENNQMYQLVTPFRMDDWG